MEPERRLQNKLTTCPRTVHSFSRIQTQRPQARHLLAVQLKPDWTKAFRANKTDTGNHFLRLRPLKKANSRSFMAHLYRAVLDHAPTERGSFWTGRRGVPTVGYHR